MKKSFSIAVFVILASLHVQASNATPMDKMKHEKVLLPKTMAIKIEKQVDELLRNYQTAFLKKDYQKFKDLVFPSYIAKLGKREVAKDKFLMIAGNNPGKILSSEVKVYNKNLAYIRLKLKNKSNNLKTTNWFEVHRFKNKWLIHDVLNDFHP